MRLNDATPADWNRVRNAQSRAILDSLTIEKQATGLDAWMRAVHDEDWYAREEEEDVVNNPDHYNTGNIECIDAIQESMSSVSFKGYLKGNCLKYLWRYDYKGKQVEDLQKAGWYLHKLTAIVNKENN